MPYIVADARLAVEGAASIPPPPGKQSDLRPSRPIQEHLNIMPTTSSAAHETASAEGASAKPSQAYELNEELPDEHVRNHL